MLDPCPSPAPRAATAPVQAELRPLLSRRTRSPCTSKVLSVGLDPKVFCGGRNSLLLLSVAITGSLGSGKTGPKTGWLQTTDIDSLTVLAASPNSRCPQGRFPLEVLKSRCSTPSPSSVLPAVLEFLGLSTIPGTSASTFPQRSSCVFVSLR